ncbi:hypothetical protein [Rhizobium sp. KDH_Rht_773_N]
MEPKSITPTAVIGNSDVSRRALLLGLAAASTVAAVAVAPEARGGETTVTTTALIENPELVTAYDKFQAACVELKAAVNDMEWLADEYRHRWPLAPEELLLNANAQDNRFSTVAAERDIVGRFLLRDTSVLTKRLPRKFREIEPKTCFTLLTTEKAHELLERWRQHVPTGRTEKSLDRNRAFREAAIRDCERDLALAVQYEAETSRLRKEAGADAAIKRVKDADKRVSAAAAEISFLPALTLEGLWMRASAANVGAYELIRLVSEDSTPLGQLARLVTSVLQFTKEQA